MSGRNICVNNIALLSGLTLGEGGILPVLEVSQL